MTDEQLSQSISQSNIQNIEFELVMLAQQQSKSWQKMAKLMMAVESQGIWRGRAPSFTQWVDAVAASARVRSSTLWRCLKAGRYYTELVGISEAKGRAAYMPALGELPDKVSPESLELCEKISRVAAPQLAESLVDRVLARDVTRQELRNTWRLYRPADESESTTQGEPERPSRTETLRVLSTQTPPWLGVLMHDLELPSGLSAVGVGKGVHLHGIYVCGLGSGGEEGSEFNAKAAAAWVDSVWVAGAPGIAEALIARFELHVGVLAIGKSVQVRREAGPTHGSEAKTGRLAKQLLGSVLRVGWKPRVQQGGGQERAERNDWIASN